MEDKKKKKYGLIEALKEANPEAAKDPSKNLGENLQKAMTEDLLTEEEKKDRFKKLRNRY